jgi:hypothetical protein
MSKNLRAFISQNNINFPYSVVIFTISITVLVSACRALEESKPGSSISKLERASTEGKASIRIKTPEQQALLESARKSEEKRPRRLPCVASATGVLIASASLSSSFDVISDVPIELVDGEILVAKGGANCFTGYQYASETLNTITNAEGKKLGAKATGKVQSATMETVRNIYIEGKSTTWRVDVEVDGSGDTLRKANVHVQQNGNSSSPKYVFAPSEGALYEFKNGSYQKIPKTLQKIFLQNSQIQKGINKGLNKVGEPIFDF